MDIYCKKAEFPAQYLYPADIVSADNYEKIPQDAVVKCTYVKTRNYKNLQRYHVFFKILFDNLAEERQLYYGNVDNFRYAVEYDAGVVEIIPLIGGGFFKKVKSVSYESMKSEDEFREAFDLVITSCLKEFKTWTRKDMWTLVENEIFNFM